jgi:hypothetical protein
MAESDLIMFACLLCSKGVYSLIHPLIYPLIPAVCNILILKLGNFVAYQLIIRLCKCILCNNIQSLLYVAVSVTWRLKRGR